jgi:bifunctional pyridoxal-dependent enzyme with beta-cystathionase and maltose regulon repressor activities
VASPILPQASGTHEVSRRTSLQECIRAVLEEALRSHVRHQRSGVALEDAESLRARVRTLCADAHGDGLRAEQLIVLVKGVCETIPEMLTLTREPGGPTVVSHVVRLVIDEFYRSAEHGD